MRKKIRLDRLVVGSMQANCYLLTDPESMKTIIIDPGDDAEYIINAITKLRAVPQLIIATHGHFDHIMAARALQLAYKIPFSIHAADVFLVNDMEKSAKHFLKLPHVDPAPVVDRTLKDRESIAVATIKLRVVACPGHTPGSIAVVAEADTWMCVGDTLFSNGAVGRTDFSYSDSRALHKSLHRLLRFPDATALYSGHGEETTIGKERKLHEYSSL